MRITCSIMNAITAGICFSTSAFAVEVILNGDGLLIPAFAIGVNFILIVSITKDTILEK